MIRISFCHIILRTRNCQRSGSVRGYQPSCWQRGPGRQSNQKVNVQQLIQGPNEGLWIWVLKLGFTIRVAQVDRCRRMQEACWCQKFNELVGWTLPLSCHTAFSISNSWSYQYSRTAMIILMNLWWWQILYHVGMLSHSFVKTSCGCIIM